MKDVKDILNEAQEKMDMAVMYLDEALAHIRAGKADVRLLDGIRVDSYGSMVPINNVAASSRKPSSTRPWASCPKTTVKLSASASPPLLKSVVNSWPSNVKAKAKRLK